MEVTTRSESQYFIIQVSGELDANSAIQLDEELLKAIEAKHPKILIDGNELKYISSPGIGVFTSKIEDCKQYNIALVIFGLNETVSNVFKILGLDQILSIAPNLDAAKNLANDVR